MRVFPQWQSSSSAVNSGLHFRKVRSAALVNGRTQSETAHAQQQRSAEARKMKKEQDFARKPAFAPGVSSAQDEVCTSFVLRAGSLAVQPF
jgi:hypothetical protein